MLAFTLRPWCMEDLDSLVLHANNPRVSSNLRNIFPFPYGREDGNHFLMRVKDITPTNIFAIEVQGEACGGIGIHLQGDIHEKSAEVGYWLGEQYWGHGVATRAVQQIIPYAFANWDIVRLFAVAFHTNIGSQRVLEKAGFVYEARLAKAAYKNGEFFDELIYAILKE